MTCIVGLVTHKGIWMGGDSAAVGGSEQLIINTDKVFANGEILIGMAGSPRIGQVLRYGFSPPRFPAEMDAEEYLVTDFADAMRARLRDSGCMAKVADMEEMCSNLLLGTRRRLFGVYGDFQVTEVVHDYDAVGCGAQVAKGSLFTIGKQLRSSQPEHAIEAALLASEMHCTGVRAPFKIVFMECRGGGPDVKARTPRKKRKAKPEPANEKGKRTNESS